jgi:antitoxin VapB
MIRHSKMRLVYALAYANIIGMGEERHVRLFRNGRSQAVRIPREFELPGKDALIRRENGRLVIEPAAPRSLRALLKTLHPIEDDFAPVPDFPAEPVDL